MSITPEAIIQVVELAVLIAIFGRMGRFSEAIDGLKRRADRLEGAVWKAGH